MADGTRDIGTVLAEFAQVLADEHDVGDILELLGNYCTELLPVHGIGVLLAMDGELTVATANTTEGDRVEQLEVDLREGPCTDAVRSGAEVLVPDLEQQFDRYPRFAPRALDLGIRSVHALPMSARTELVGSLDIIAQEPLKLSAAQVSTAQVLADVAIAYLANSRVRESTSRLAQQLQHALDNRVVIEQAKGKLAERHGEAPTDAFERIRRHARTNHITARMVAEQVLNDDVHI